MRTIKEIIIHCTATPEGRDVTVDEIGRWHKTAGFKEIGYHFVVYRNGSIIKGRREDRVGAHCRGHNRNSIGVCYVGGCDSRMNPKDTRTPAQKESLEKLIVHLLRLHPGAEVHGHRDFAAKACPGFDATAEYASLLAENSGHSVEPLK